MINGFQILRQEYDCVHERAVLRPVATVLPALPPVDVSIRLTDGTELSWRCDQMLASPTRRLTREQHLTKFRPC